jgi:hypothetical protein
MSKNKLKKVFEISKKEPNMLIPSWVSYSFVENYLKPITDGKRLAGYFIPPNKSMAPVIYLKPEYRGKGISKKLVQSKIKNIPEGTYTAPILNTNSQSIGLMKSLGFERKGDFPYIDNSSMYGFTKTSTRAYLRKLPDLESKVKATLDIMDSYPTFKLSKPKFLEKARPKTEAGKAYIEHKKNQTREERFNNGFLIQNAYTKLLGNIGVPSTTYRYQELPMVSTTSLKQRLLSPYNLSPETVKNYGHNLKALDPETKIKVESLLSSPKSRAEFGSTVKIPGTSDIKIYEFDGNPYNLSDIVNLDKQLFKKKSILEESPTGKNAEILKDFFVKSKNTGKSKILRRAHKMSGGSYKNLAELVNSPEYKFLLENNYERPMNKQLYEPAIKVYERFPKNNTKANIALLEEGLLEDVDFEKLLKNLNGTPGQVRSQYIRTLHSSKVAKNHKKFIRDFPEHAEKVTERSVEIPIQTGKLVDIKGSDLSGFAGKRTCFGNVCISNSWQGKSDLGNSYADATLKGNAKIHTYVDDDFKALLYSKVLPNKKYKLLEMKGPNDAEIDITLPKYKKMKSQLTNLGFELP